MTILLKSLSQKEDFDGKAVETRCFRCVATNGATNKASATTPIGSASAGTLTVAHSTSTGTTFSFRPAVAILSFNALI